ncbi:MAG TPA: glycosyltransferase family 4 protein, partial [Syntrophales bacterium]|nr:glycosyltransferase family 4 protein [Syntrophales bacterium]
DLSTVIFAKSFLKFVKDRDHIEGYTISPVLMNYIDQLDKLVVRHYPVRMGRYVSPYSDLCCFLSVYGICRRERFDAVINFTTKPNVLGAVAARWAGVTKVVCAVRGLGGPFLPQSDLKGRLLQRMVKILYRLACSMSDKVWFTNQGDMDYFLQGGLVGLEKTVKTTNALDIAEYSQDCIDKDEIRKLKRELALQENDKIVVMVGRMIWSKGIREFVEAAESVGRERPDLKFILVAPGEKGHPDEVPDSFITAKGKMENFIWLGFRKDVKNIYAISDLAVLPSYYNEGGYPRALLEPMAFGKPVITTDLPQCRGPVEDGRNGYLIPPRDAGALQEAILKVFGNEEERRRMGVYSRVKIESEFDDRRVVEKILSNIGAI